MSKIPIVKTYIIDYITDSKFSFLREDMKKTKR